MESAPRTLICAAPGTSLSPITLRLKHDLIGGAVLDLEDRICTDLTGNPLAHVNVGQKPKMESVVRLPRSDLFAKWETECRASVDEIVELAPGNPGILSLHLTWYNSSSNEFFSPFKIAELRKAKFDRVIILIDDIYDMFARLQGTNDLYSADVRKRLAGQIAKLGYPRKLIPPAEHDALNAQLDLETVELGLSHLLAWRRAEMVQAENIAANLGAKLTTFGIKHSYQALKELLTDRSTPEVYLSHRITEVRRLNLESASLPDDLGSWSPVAAEVNKLHSGLASEQILILNPTAIDELRFEAAKSRTERSRFLSSRWPLLEPTDQLLAQPVASGHEHTRLFDDSRLDAAEPLPGSIVRSLSNRVFVEIAFRDHIIVEHTAGLCVFRPFYMGDPSDVDNCDWSGGVKPEIVHWKSKLNSGGPAAQDRKAAFVHTREEVRSRLRWLKRPSNQKDARTNFVSHMRKSLTAGQIPAEDVNKFLEYGERAHKENQATHLDMNPVDSIKRRSDDISSWLDSAALAVLFNIFTQIDRPKDGGEVMEFSVALLIAEETQSREVEDLEAVTASLAGFFREKETAETMSRRFWTVLDTEFRGVFNCASEDFFCALLGVSRTAK